MNIIEELAKRIETEAETKQKATEPKETEETGTKETEEIGTKETEETGTETEEI